MDIEPDSRLRERRANQEKCESLLARYRRNFNEALAVVARLAELKLTATVTGDSPEIVEMEIRRQLAANNDVQAVSNATQRIQMLQKSADDLRQRLEATIATLISRFSALSERINLLNTRGGQLATAVFSSLPSTWSPAARSEVEKALHDTLADSRAPACPSPSMDAASIAALEAAEHALASAEMALTKGAAQVSEKMRSCHADAILDAVCGKGAPIEKIEEWLSAAGKDETATEQEIDWRKKVDSLLTKITLLTTSDDWPQLLLTAQEAQCLPNALDRRRGYENLALLCSTKLKLLTETVLRMDSVSALRDEAAQHPSAELDAAFLELEKAAAENGGRFTQLEQELRGLIQREKMVRESILRRSAVLDALRDLGYEISDDMAVSVPEGGKLILQRDGEDQYGVELVSSPDGTLMQTALVRFADDTLPPTDQQRRRDQEREEEWCSDHAAMRKRLSDSGWQTNMKVEIPAGGKAVRVLPKHGRSRRSSRDVAKASKHKGINSP